MSAERRIPPSTERVAVYPGSFDPFTNGHVDIIERGARLFDRIIVAILINREKTPLFSVEDRVQMARDVFRDEPKVEVDTFDGLLVDFAQQKGAQVIVRGLRAIYQPETANAPAQRVDRKAPTEPAGVAGTEADAAAAADLPSPFGEVPPTDAPPAAPAFTAEEEPYIPLLIEALMAELNRKVVGDAKTDFL